MDFFGFSFQELAVLIVVVAMVWLHIVALRHLWLRPVSLVYKIAWSAAMFTIPFVAPLLYFWLKRS